MVECVTECEQIVSELRTGRKCVIRRGEAHGGAWRRADERACFIVHGAKLVVGFLLSSGQERAGSVAVEEVGSLAAERLSFGENDIEEH